MYLNSSFREDNIETAIIIKHRGIMLSETNLMTLPCFVIFVFVPYYIPHLRCNFFNKANITDTIVVNFEPPENLPPLICNLLYSKYSSDPYGATFLNLVDRGIILVKKIEGDDYELHLQNTEKLFNFEKFFIKMTFWDKTVMKMSQMPSSLFKISGLFKAAFVDLNNLGLSESKYKFKLGTAVMIGLLLNIFYFGLGNPFSLAAFALLNLLIAPALVSGAISYPVLTERGKSLASKVAGFHLFLSTTEKYRAQFDEKRSLFYNYLPYAVLYRLTNVWCNNVGTAMFTFDKSEKNPLKFIEVYANGKNVIGSNSNLPTP